MAGQPADVRYFRAPSLVWRPKPAEGGAGFSAPARRCFSFDGLCVLLPRPVISPRDSHAAVWRASAGRGRSRRRRRRDTVQGGYGLARRCGPSGGRGERGRTDPARSPSDNIATRSPVRLAMRARSGRMRVKRQLSRVGHGGTFGRLGKFTCEV
jgi:hypothetical protein